MNLKNFFFLAIVALFLASCGDDEVRTPSFKHVELLTMENIINTQTMMESPTAHSGKNICHIDSLQGFGVSYFFQIPDSLIGKRIAVEVNAWVRTGKIDNKCDFICSVMLKDSCLLWAPFGSNSVMVNPGEWANINNTIFVEAAMTSKPNTSINVMSHNIDSKSYFDIDDLIITYREADNF